VIKMANARCATVGASAVLGSMLVFGGTAPISTSSSLAPTNTIPQNVVLVASALPATTSNCDEGTHYINSSGHCVHRPEAVTRSSAPAGATAQCKDGDYSFSQHRTGTCSGHGGVANWL
jgi:hypothetical protein